MSPFVRRDVRSADGNVVAAYARTRPGAPTAVLFNAVGIPRAIFGRIAARLDTCSIVTWETRGLPSPEVASNGDFASARHLDDALAVFDAFELDRPHVVGWCSGADTAVVFERLHPDRVASLSLVNGAYGFEDDGLWSEYEAALTRMFAGFLRNRRVEGPMHKALLSLVEARVADDEHSDADLRDILLFPFQTPDRLRAYARLCIEIKTARRTDTFAAVEAPTLYITGDADPVQPHQSTLHAHSLTPNSALRVVDGGDHNALYTRPEVADAVAEFIAA